MALAQKRDAVELDVDSVLCMGVVRERSHLLMSIRIPFLRNSLWCC
jgi:hypothetical protein